MKQIVGEHKKMWGRIPLLIILWWALFSLPVLGRVADALISSRDTLIVPSGSLAGEQDVLISGYIVDEEGNPLPDATVFFDSGGSTDTTDSEGYYEMLLPHGWSGTAYPHKGDYLFDPENRVYEAVVRDLDYQNYEGYFPYVPPGWEVVASDLSHTIAIPSSAYMTLLGAPVAMGDLIGVFYWDEITQSEKCGGFSSWNGPCALMAFGDDLLTPEKDGFTEGEPFRWRIHRIADSTDHEAMATYRIMVPYTSDGNYYTNALSQIQTLQAEMLTVTVLPEETELCPGDSCVLTALPQGGSGIYTYSWSSLPAGFSSSQEQVVVSPDTSTYYYCEVATYAATASKAAWVSVAPFCQVTQTVPLPAGWSGLSSWVLPNDTVVETLFAPYEADFVVLKNLQKTYWPPYANTLVTWNPWDGYMVKMNSVVEMLFTGVPVEDQTVTLKEGWNLIPVLSPESVSVVSLFEPLGEDLIMVKEVAGTGVYWPSTQVNTLQVLTPGMAYWAALASSGQIDYGAVSKTWLTQVRREVRNPWNEVVKTGSSHVIALPDSALSPFTPGDVIGAFNARGACVGAVELLGDGAPTAMVLFGDDPTSEVVDGLVQGEFIRFRLWDVRKDSEVLLAAQYSEDYPDKEYFRSNGVSLVVGFTPLLGEDEAPPCDVILYPIPTPKNLFVEVTPKQPYGLEIYTEEGQRLRQEPETSGTTKINVEKMTPGIYIIRITVEKGVLFRKFVVS
ncbi:MAG: hypothetical protein CSA04_00060 [Bacteroidetes bacterium]|nr:MAG: hypothetical protein CSA04_00060 [Bacteroidota bacterium]